MIRQYLAYRRRQKWAKEVSALDPLSVLKEFLLDTQLGESQQLAILLGLPEITDEDLENSEERFAEVSDSLPLILFYSSNLATSVMSYYDLVSPAESPFSDGERQRVETWLAKILTANAIGILSQFSDLKLIEVKR